MLRARHGQAGYDLAVAERPDIIVTDLMLPDIDDWIVCAWLRSNPATAAIPIIVLTARDDHDIPLSAGTTNIAALLHKPCPLPQRLAAIDGALGPQPHGL